MRHGSAAPAYPWARGHYRRNGRRCGPVGGELLQPACRAAAAAALSGMPPGRGRGPCSRWPSTRTSTSGATRSSNRSRSGACRRERRPPATRISRASAGCRPTRWPRSRVGSPPAPPKVIPCDLPPAREFTAPSALDAADLAPRPDQKPPRRRDAAGTSTGASASRPRSPEDRYFTTAVVVPGNPRIVHHMLAMVGSHRGVDADDVGADWGPTVRTAIRASGGRGSGSTATSGAGRRGPVPWDLPEGVGMLPPKGARVAFQLHYHNAQLAARRRI